MNICVYTEPQLLPNDDKSTTRCNRNIWNLCPGLL